MIHPPMSTDCKDMLNLGYVFPTYLLEKQKPMSVSTDLVEPGSETTDLAENKS